MPFKKGLIPWNKGLKDSNKSNRTSFKKGMIPWNKGIKTGLIPKTAFKKGYYGGKRFQKGHIPWMKGKNHSIETKIKLAKATKQLWQEGKMSKSLEAGFKKGQESLKGMLGKKMSEESKRKISLANKGKKKPPRTLEHSKKLSIALKGNKIWLGKKHTEETKNKLSKENHWNWLGGKSFEPYTVDWTETLRRSIRERDKYICQLCNLYGNTVHHIDYNKKNCNLDNLITLCRSCNIKVNHNRNYWTNYFNEK